MFVCLLSLKSNTAPRVGAGDVMLRTHLQVVSGDSLVLSFLFTFWTLVFPLRTLIL